MSEEAARLLAEIHAARGLMRAAGRDAKGRSGRGPGNAALWAHATRSAGQPIDLAVERAIRTDPETARRYRTMLAGQALAHARLAVAASDGSLSRRRVGPFELEIVPADGDAPPLLIVRAAQSGQGPPPRVIEALLGRETVRLDLPPPIEGAIALALDPLAPEAVRLGALLRDPACAVFLL